MTVTACLEHDQLEQYALGLLPEREAFAIEQHLGQCDECLSRLDKISVTDPLLASAKAQPRMAPLPEDEHLISTLIRRLSEDTAVPTRETQFDFLSPPQAANEIGRLGDYRVLSVLGRGGMGVVFKAQDDRLDRTVAIKVIKPEWMNRPTIRERFLREARAAAKVDHDHIVAIFHVGEQGEVLFLVMPLLVGETLADRLQRSPPLSLAEVFRIGVEAAAGLSRPTNASCFIATSSPAICGWNRAAA